MNDAGAREARFDPDLQAWILSSYADVSAALRDPRLAPAGLNTDAVPPAAVRSPARTTFAARSGTWRDSMTASARRMAEDLPAGQPIDLVQLYARPWSRQLASRVTGAAEQAEDRLDRLARDIFLAAATATDPHREPDALDATAQLAQALPSTDPTLAVQAYVALTHTLPCLLAGVWYELFRATDLAERMRTQPGIATGAIEELLRVTSVGRAVFRIAVGDIQTDTMRVRTGQGVILMLAAANRDPARFPHPAAIDPSRRPGTHLAFGQGSHSCVGASVVRMAAAITTGALLDATSDVEVVGQPEWIGGFSIRAPANLPVRLTRRLEPCA